MKDNWKILRGNEETPQQKIPAPGARPDEVRRGEVLKDGARREEGGVDRYGDPVTPEQGGKRSDRPGEVLPLAQQPVPKRHFIMGLCILAVVCLGWLFRQEVRGIASWAAAKARGEDIPLSAKAPGLGNAFRFGREYTLEEFFTVCTEGTVTAAAKILDRQPALLKPKDGTSILHMAAARPINPEIFGLLLKRAGKGAINAKDAKGRTPLHIAAASPVPPGFILALRTNGANVIVLDTEGDTPVDAFFTSAFSKPGALTKEERALFGTYGHHVPLPYNRDKNGNPRTVFRPLAEQVPDTEGKRYFTQLAHAASVGKDAGAPAGMFASGDMVGPKRRETPSYEIQQARGRGTYREPVPPLWKSLKVAPDTGTALVRLKCLLPMAYPSSLNFFSARMVGTMQKPDYVTEWNAWDVPGEARMAILMESLRQRMQQHSVRTSSKAPDGGGFGANRNFGIEATRAMRERGDDPAIRNPLVMTWMLLEYDPAVEGEMSVLLTHTDVPMVKEGAGEKDAHTGKELENLRALRMSLPKEVWQRVGKQLVAAAYAADKRRDTRWGAGFMPGYYRKNGGMSAIRLWGCEGGKDFSEPLRRVLAETPNVPSELAKAMVALVLRSGPQSTARDSSGKTPAEYAKGMDVPADIAALVAKIPVYEPSSSRGTELRPEEAGQKNAPAVPPRSRLPLGTVRNSTI